jgi:ribosomal peptide maturation radical SAM protein 1
MSRPQRVLLLSMPWHALDRPSLGLSLLQASARRGGTECDVRYLGFHLADRMGLDEYMWVHEELPYPAFAGDWLFTPSLYGDRADADARYVRDVLRRAWRLPERAIDRLLRQRAHCEPFLDHCVDSIDWAAYDVVGFTSTFAQNIASLALARRVKRLHPRTITVFGGANWEDEMGEELHARFPFVDVVCTGEADVSFPAFLERLRNGAHPADPAIAADVCGLIIRRDGRSVRTPAARPIADLDRLPRPLYDDYFEGLSASASSSRIRPTLLLETSRGCWWGARHHCTFCGLNGGTMAFRSKSPERVLAELHDLRRYRAGAVAAVDNILDMRYFTTVLPELAAATGPPMSLFYEVKANLTAEQVRMLAAAGVRHVQPGMESLSDHVLSLMRKGTTALQNIQTLKWCKEFGVTPDWNLIYGVPGETAEDYSRMLEVLDAIDFLPPPGAITPIRLDRFSPYHGDPAGFGLTDVRPMAVYRHLYPFPDGSLRRLAYYFDFAYADGRDPLGYAAPALNRVEQWMRRGFKGTLSLVRRADDDLFLIDTRSGTRRSHHLTGWRAAVYARCDKVTAESAAVATGTAEGAEAATVRRFLRDCRHRRLMVNVDDRWLALGVHCPPRTERTRSPDGESNGR